MMNKRQRLSSLAATTPDVENSLSRQATAATATSEMGVPLLVVTRCLALVICIGAAVSIASQYTWLPFRETDLYAWAPGTPTYRPHEGRGNFILPRDYTIPKEGVLLGDDFPAMQVFGSPDESSRALERRVLSDAPEIVVERIISFQEEDKLSREWRELRRKLSIYTQYHPNSSVHDRLVLSSAAVIAKVAPLAIDDDWITWMTKTNNILVNVTVFPNQQSLRAVFWRELRPMPYERSYTASPVYHLLMLVPVVLLLTNQATLKRTFGTTRSARQGLFETVPRWAMTFKHGLVDPLVIVVCYCEATNDLRVVDVLSYDGRELMTWLCLIMISAAAALVAFLARSSTSSLENRSRFDTPLFWKGVSKIVVISQALVLVLITYSSYKYETQKNFRLSSYCIQRVTYSQLLMGGVFSEIVWRWSNKTTMKVMSSHEKSLGKSSAQQPVAPEETVVLSRATIEAGVTKFVTSMLFYTAGVTKIAEAGGLGYINDRYLAQLSLRGRYAFDDKPYPLEALLLYVPRVFRAAGMAVILLMELSSLGSWFYFFSYLTLWLVFMTGASLSIGVPFRADMMFAVLGEQGARALWSRLEIGLAVLAAIGAVMIMVLLFRWAMLRRSTKTEKTG